MTKATILLAGACFGCTGLISTAERSPDPRAIDRPTGPSTPGTAAVRATAPALVDPALFGKSGLRRLSRQEYRATVLDLTGVDMAADLNLLPNDAASTYFDNDFTSQVASPALVEGVKALADQVADRASADPALLTRILPCKPAGPGDSACFQQFIRSFGRRALRRSLADDEVARYATLQKYAVQDGNFNVGVALVVRVLLQDLELLYRVENGAPVAGQPGLVRLDGRSLASRLSYLLWGSGPDDDLLASAETGKLETPADVRAAGVRMLGNPKAQAQIARFHALWLSYAQLPLPVDLAAAMHAETDALVKRVVFTDKRPWTDLFTMTESWIDATLAQQYGLPAPGGKGFAWVPYGGSGRRGILSHGAVLSNGIKFGDTSPVQRGVFIRNRVFCQDIPPPSAANVKVNVDQPPQGGDPSACKADRYAQHRADPACAACHALMDPVGMGLENFDGAGRFRQAEPDKPRCTIAGEGQVVGVPGVSTFHGPGELGATAVASGALGPCVVSELYQFALGRPLRGSDDAAVIAALTAQFTASYRLDEWLLGFVTTPAFRHRVAE